MIIHSSAWVPSCLNGARIGKKLHNRCGCSCHQGTDIPDGSLAFGSPAKVVRALTADEIEENHRNAMHYVEIARESLNLILGRLLHKLANGCSGILHEKK